MPDHSKREQLFYYQDSDFNVHHTVSENFEDPYTKLHLHTLYEVYCFLDGAGVFTVEGNTYTLESGTILFLRPGEAHSVKIEPSLRYERIALHFPSSCFKDNAAMCELLQSFDTHEAGIGNCFFCNDETEYHLKLLREMTNPRWQSRRGVCRLALETNLPALLYSLSNNYSRNISVDMLSSDRLVRRIIRFIDENLASEWTLEQLAERLYRDKATLNRRFKNVVGTSIWDYTIQKRVIHAQRNLYRLGSIPEAFKQSGFRDYSTFFRNYTKITGVTPSEDIRRHKAEQSV